MNLPYFTSVGTEENRNLTREGWSITNHRVVPRKRPAGILIPELDRLACHTLFKLAGRDGEGKLGLLCW
jgi:hypothetical protein